MTKEQHRLYNKRYRERHKEKIKEINKRYIENNRDKINQIAKRNYDKNKDRINARRRENYDAEKSKKYREENKNIIKERQKEFRKNNPETVKQYSLKYYNKNKEKILYKNSINHCNKDFSPNQNNMTNVTKSEKSKYIHKMSSAVPSAHKNNKYSNRKGVRWDKKDNKWWGYITHNKKQIIGRFNTEQEAIDYRIYLEDTYYTPEQLAIRDKYKNEI